MLKIITRNLAARPRFQSSGSSCITQLHPEIYWFTEMQVFQLPTNKSPSIINWKHKNLQHSPDLTRDCASFPPIAGKRGKSGQNLKTRWKKKENVSEIFYCSSNKSYLKGGVTSALPSGSKPRKEPLSEVALGEGAMVALRGAAWDFSTKCLSMWPWRCSSGQAWKCPGSLCSSWKASGGLSLPGTGGRGSRATAGAGAGGRGWSCSSTLILVPANGETWWGASATGLWRQC